MRRDACDLITSRGFPGDVCATALVWASADAGLRPEVHEMAHDWPQPLSFGLFWACDGLELADLALACVGLDGSDPQMPCIGP